MEIRRRNHTWDAAILGGRPIHWHGPQLAAAFAVVQSSQTPERKDARRGRCLMARVVDVGSRWLLNLLRITGFEISKSSH